MKISESLIIFSISAAVICGCSSKLNEPKADSGIADVSRCVSAGGDFLSGYSDDALRPHGQLHSIAALITQQFALAGGGAFTTLPLSQHSTTNMEVIQKFLEVKFDVVKLSNRAVQVVIENSIASGSEHR